MIPALQRTLEPLSQQTLGRRVIAGRRIIRQGEPDTRFGCRDHHEQKKAEENSEGKHEMLWVESTYPQIYPVLPSWQVALHFDCTRPGRAAMLQPQCS